MENRMIMEANTEMTQEEVAQMIDEVLPETPTVERPYTLRKLQDSDLFPLLQLLRKLGFKDMKETFNKYKGTVRFNKKDYESEEEAAKALKELKEKAGTDIVFDMADFVLSKLDTHSDAIYDFFASMAGVPADAIKQMEFGTLPLMIYDTFSEVKNTAFFKVLTKSL